MLHHEDFFPATMACACTSRSGCPRASREPFWFSFTVLPNTADTTPQRRRSSRVDDTCFTRWIFAVTAARRVRAATFARFDQYLDDLDVLAGRAVARQPEKPWFLWGHSMGGLIATAWAIVRQPACRGLVLSAPLLRAADPIYPRLRRFAGPLSRIFPRWRAIRVNFGGISRDPPAGRPIPGRPAGVSRPLSSPHRRGNPPRDAFRVRTECRDPPSPPGAARSGRSVVRPGRQPRSLYAHAAAGDKTLRLYEGLYHDVLREPEAEQVLADLIAWLDRRC